MAAPLFDVHCHLQAAELDGDRPEVIERARAAGVVRVLAVAEDLEDAHRVLELAAREPGFVAPALGVHPDRAPHVGDDEVAAVEALARRHAPRLAAIGEVGLDYRPLHDEGARARQREVLARMIRLARELALPLSVHSRSAGHHALRLLDEERAELACLHAFDGRAAHAGRGAAAGRLFSVPPSLVRSPVKRSWARRLPREALLLESDSPVLGPVPGERNEPANLRIALAELARLRGDDEDELAAALAATTARAFPRLVRSPA